MRLEVAEHLRSAAMDTSTVLTYGIQMHLYVPRKVQHASVQLVRPPATRSGHRCYPTERFRLSAQAQLQHEGTALQYRVTWWMQCR
jgi:hypothetical protein